MRNISPISVSASDSGFHELDAFWVCVVILKGYLLCSHLVSSGRPVDFQHPQNRTAMRPQSCKNSKNKTQNISLGTPISHKLQRLTLMICLAHYQSHSLILWLFT